MNGGHSLVGMIFFTKDLLNKNIEQNKNQTFCQTHDQSKWQTEPNLNKYPDQTKETKTRLENKVTRSTLTPRQHIQSVSFFFK